MLRKRKIGLIIWGSILTVLALPLTIAFAIVGNEGWIIALVVLIPGVALLISGSVNSIIVSSYNRQLIKNGAGPTYIARCNSCNVEFTVRETDFKKGRENPEGIVRCPNCRRQISKHLCNRSFT